jgi:hypothetical protein
MDKNKLLRVVAALTAAFTGLALQDWAGAVLFFLMAMCHQFLLDKAPPPRFPFWDLIFGVMGAIGVMTTIGLFALGKHLAAANQLAAVVHAFAFVWHLRTRRRSEGGV